MSTAAHSELNRDSPEEREFELRAAIGSHWTGGRLFIGMFTFLLASEAFAYFYLRSSNSGQLWRPLKVTAPTSFGSAIFAIMLASALFVIYGQWRLRRGSLLDWQIAGWTAVGGGVLAFVLQILQLTKLPFFPGSSGYASCFIGWAVMNLVLIFSATYWIETNVARSMRLGQLSLAMDADGQLFRANVASCTYFWGFAAIASTLFWAMFYLL